VGGLADALRWAVVVTAIATGVTSVVPQLRKTAFGLVERLLYVAMIAFLLTVSIEAVRVLG
jgi:cell division protein FtsL